MFSLDAKLAGYDDRRSALFYETLRQRFASLPGVLAASMSDMPLGGGGNNADGIVIPGMTAYSDHPLSINDVLVGPSFFSTMQIPILLGRPIDGGDTADALHVAVVNEVFAKKFFPHRNPIGQHFTFNSPTDVQIVGVAKNSLYSSLKSEIPPVAYVPWSQIPPGWLPPGMCYELRTLGDPLALANSVREVVHRASPLVACGRCLHSGALHRLDDCARAHVCGPIYRVWDAGAHHCLRWVIRHYGVLGRSSHERDRGAHRTRRATWGRDLERSARSPHAIVDRGNNWAELGVGNSAIRGVFLVSCSPG